MIKYYKFSLAVFVLTLFVFSGCSHNRWKPDVSKIEANVKFIRLEKQLYGMDTLHYDAEMQKIIKQYPDFMRFFITSLHTYGRWNDPMTLVRFRKVYLSNPFMKDSLYKDVEKQYTPQVISGLETDFSEAFRHIKYYYPKDTLPKVMTMIGPFGFQSYTFENYLVIAPEMFLGEHYRYYPSIDMPDYKTKTMRKEYILSSALKTIFQNKYDEDKYCDNTMLSKMIYMGKRLFYLDAMKPDMPDSEKIEYSKKQLKWCKDYEGDMWNHLVTKNLLYTTDQDKIGKYTNEGPFTNDADVPQESAPRLGEWVGWQIVKKYMDENPDVTLDALFKDKDYRKILTLSRYKPSN